MKIKFKFKVKNTKTNKQNYHSKIKQIKAYVHDQTKKIDLKANHIKA